MSEDDRWLTVKDRLIEELDHYIRRCAAKASPPIEYIKNLLDIQTQAVICTREELEDLLAWWNDVRPEDQPALTL
jgi:hypothetical protein